jgi:hypothetical protein
MKKLITLTRKIADNTSHLNQLQGRIAFLEHKLKRLEATLGMINLKLKERPAIERVNKFR